MGCFLGCFVSSSKDKKCRKQRYRVIPRNQKPRIQDILRVDESLDLSIKEAPSNLIRESREKTEAPPLSLKRRKKVTFDTNVITYEHVQVYDSTESLLERNEKGETFPKSKDEDAFVLSTSNYRYGNYVESDDYFDQEDYDLDEDYYDDDLDDEDEDENEDVLVGSMESNRINERDNNGYVLSVLKPVENLDQWRALISKGSARKPLNVNGQTENAPAPKNQNQETVVDTSLSSWIISSEKSKRNNNRVACCYYNNNNEVLC